MLQTFPNSSILHNIRGASHLGLGQCDEAIASYGQALQIEPRDAKTHFNLGVALSEKGDLPAAIDSYREALQLEPQYGIAHNNLGNTLKDAGDLAAAVASYRAALKVDPDHPMVHCNLGNALKDVGDLDGALASYRQALQIDPDYAEAYNNMGSALMTRADTGEAINCYKQALALRPDYADAAWNLVGTAANSFDAEDWLERCLALDRDHIDARLNRCVLQFFKGDRAGLDQLKQSALGDHPLVRSLEWLASLPSLPELHFNRWSLFDSIKAQCDTSRPFYEFGVFTGDAFRYLMRSFDQGFGFDTFEGLPEDWHDEKAGSYSSAGKIPEVEGGEFIAGKFEDTLPKFFAEPRPLAALINFDADLYSSTLCALNNAKPVIDSQTLLIFDEFIVNEHWEQDEYKALAEYCEANGCSYEVLAVSFFTKQAAVRLIGI